MIRANATLPIAQPRPESTATEPLVTLPINIDNHDTNEITDSKYNNVDNSSDYSSDFHHNEYCNILLVGIGLNRKLLAQLEKSSNGYQINISNCLDETV